MLTFYQILLGLAFSAWQTNEFQAEVTSVEDGDTIEVLYNHKPTKIRIFGIDCPEDGQAFSAKAKQYTTALCYHKKVRVIKKGIDKDRIVGEVYLDDNRSLAKELLAAGYAWHHKQYSNDVDLAKLEEEAHKKKKGLWIEDMAVSPWDYKKAKQEKNK